MSGVWFKIKTAAGAILKTVFPFTTAKGDLVVRGAADNGILAVGTDGKIPVADSTATLGVKWGTAVDISGLGSAAFQPTTAFDAAGAAASVAAVTQPLDGDLTAIAALAGTGFAVRTGSNTWTLDTSTYLTTSAASATYLTIVNAASLYQQVDADLTAIAALSSTGFLKRTGTNTWFLDSSTYLTTGAAFSLYQPLDGDLTALAALSGTNTIYYRSAADTWTAVTIGAGMTFAGGSLASSVVGVTDGDKGDIVVSSTGTVWTIDTSAVTTTKIADANVTLPKLESRARPYENALINGGCQLFQRQAPTTATARSDDTYGPDRWNVLTQTASVNVERIAGSTSQYAMRLTQNQAASQRFGVEQIVEANDSIPRRSRSVVFQFRARMTSGGGGLRYAILEWTGTADAVTSDVVLSWTSTTYTAGNFFLASNLTVTATGTAGIVSGTWTDFSLTATLGASCNNLIVLVWTDAAQVTGVTLDFECLGLFDGASTRDWLPPVFVEELTRARRYYQKTYELDTAPATATFNGGVCSISTQNGGSNNECLCPFIPQMRVAPSVTLYSGGTGASGKVRNAQTGADVANTTTAISVGNAGFLFIQNSGPSLPQGNVSCDFHFTADAEL